MAKLIRQFSSMLKAGVDSLFEPAEDPRKTFSDPWQRQQELLSRVKGALAQNLALRSRLEKRSEHLQASLPQLAEAARQAVSAERDDQARLALQQRQLALLEQKSLQETAQQVRLEGQRISIIEQRLTAQVEALRVRQEMSAARYSAAESQVIVQEVLSGFSKELGELSQTLERTEYKTEHMQALASAIEEFADSATLDLAAVQASDPVAQQLIQMDIDKAVEAQLAELKRTEDR